MQETVTCPYCDLTTATVNIDLDSMGTPIPIKCSSEACGLWYAATPNVEVTVYELVEET